MPSLHFHMDSSMTPDEVMGVLTDFTPARVERWPSIDAEHFQVHDRGDTWAEITEGNDKTWENARYEWDPSHNRVTVTTHDSTPFGPGGWDFRLTPTAAGTGSTSAWSGTPARSRRSCSRRSSRSRGRCSASPSGSP